MRHPRSIAARLAITLVLAPGCADLAAVRDFAKTSAATADYRQIVNDYVTSPVRQKRYQPERSGPTLDLLYKQREAQRPLLEGVQSVLVDYLNALAALAADDLTNVDDEIEGLSKALEQAQFVGDGDRQINTQTATAAAELARILIRAGLEQWRQRQVKKIVREADPPLQKVVAGLREIVTVDFATSLRNEETAVEKPFEAWVAEAKSRNDPDAVPPVARILLSERLEGIESRRQALAAYAKVLTEIGEGHADLAKNVDRLRAEDVADQMRAYARDLKALYKAIQQLGS